MVVLKARQQGLSTIISALHYWWVTYHLAQKGLLIAHEADSTTTLFDMFRRMHEHLPEEVRLETKYSSRTELVFNGIDSAVRVATAGGKGIARGETITFLHCSEVAFWPTKFADANFGGLIKAVPTAPGTFVFIESTAQGMTGKFRDLWVAAVEGKSEFEAFFSSWVESAEYQRRAPDDFKLTDDERRIIIEAKQKFGIEVTNNQLQWRRIEVGRDGVDMFNQECPLLPDDAFLSTGAPIFNLKLIADRLSKLKEKPLLKCRKEILVGKVEESENGRLWIYKDVSDQQTYFIGADVGVGIRGKDLSVACVLDARGHQVAVWNGTCHPDVFADILVTLGYYFNSAVINCERNNHGLLTVTRLRDANYPALFTEETEGTLDPTDSINIGLYVTEKTKPLIINKLRAYFRDKEITVNHPDTLREMQTFVLTEGGRMEADSGAHDDQVMALAHACHILEKSYEPVVVTDDYYAEAI